MRHRIDLNTIRFLNTAFLAAVLSLQSCDEKPPVNVEDLLPVAGTRLAVLCDEGNFQWGNADITVYDTDRQSVIENAFSRSNNNPLGDVCQSASYFSTKLFLVINNSQKIEIVSPSDFKKQQTINGFHSPRYITWVNAGKGYVSEYYANSIKVINPIEGRITEDIKCPGWHDEMIFTRGKLYITSINRDKLYVLNEQTNELIDSIPLSYGSNSLALDANDKLWVLCTGDAGKGTDAQLYRIHTGFDTVERIIQLHKPTATRLCTNTSRTQLFWISGDIYSLQAIDESAVPIPFISASGRQFYGLNYNPFTDELWATDAIDYTQRSVVYRYRIDGAAIGQFRSGINTGNMVFYAR